MKYIAFDMSSFCWRGLLAGKDAENGRKVLHDGKEVLINSALYGYENVLSLMLGIVEKNKAQPIQCLLVFEGMNSKSKRQLINREYKAGAARAPEAYEEFHKLKEMLQELWLGLGAQCMWQDYAEGDDTLAWLAENMEEDLLICTYDNDLTALNMVNAYGATVEVWIDQLVGCNKYGVFDYHLVTTYKALVGDSSDNIKGCVGFGPSAFEKYCMQYGYDGLQDLHDLLLANDLGSLAEAAEDPQHKLLKKIVEQAAAVQNSFDLARLRPAWVNTMKHPLTWRAGMVRQLRPGDDIRLKKWYGRSRLVTGDIFDEAVAWAMPLIAASEEVSLDIETSTSDESDEWLAAQGNTDGVDVFGSVLTGLGLTFGKNNQYSLYFSVDHADTVNCDSEKLRQFIAALDKPLVIQNVSFELTVLFNEWGERQMDNGVHGFLPNVLDTKIEASYVDENNPLGLKERSYSTLRYAQQTYDETTKLSGFPEDLFPGGRLLNETEPTYETTLIGTGHFEPGEPEWVYSSDGVPLTNDDGTAMMTPAQGAEIMKSAYVLNEAGEKIVKTPPIQTRRYKMNELPATHVTGYGLDDTICAVALHNYYRLFMQLEHTWNVYLEVEIDAAYQHAKNFVDGFDISLEKMNALAKEDDATFDASWTTLRSYLIKHGWAGTTPPTYNADITPAQVKEAFEIVAGRVMATQMRNIDKLAKFAEAEGHPAFAGLLMDMVFDTGVPADEAAERFTAYVRSFFKGEPQFNDGSPKQMQHLLYEVMKLPIRVRNKPTPNMRAAGVFEGSPKTDVLAITYALQECSDEQKEVLEALKLMGMVGTRRSLYYDKYPYFPHWKDGKIRSSHNQCSTNTRRASSSKPNTQQLPKHPKIEGHMSRFREIITPHVPNGVIVSIDFKAQELRLIADYSQDPAMLSCYVGDNLRDQHSLVGLSIAQRENEWKTLTYEQFEDIRHDEHHPDHKEIKAFRVLGKKVGFTTEYGAMAPKLAITIQVSEEEAQEFIDAKEAAFAVAAKWKETVVAEAKQYGVVRTMMGAVRHLGPALTSGDRWISSKAERQSVNFKIQGSSAEQTKLAEGRMWNAGLAYKYDAVCIGPIHDELVWSVAISDLFEFIPAMHACMVAPYATMQVPVEGDISFGWDFFNQVEIGSVPSKEAIQKGLAKLQELKYAA